MRLIIEFNYFESVMLYFASLSLSVCLYNLLVEVRMIFDLKLRI